MAVLGSLGDSQTYPFKQLLNVFYGRAPDRVPWI